MRRTETCNTGMKEIDTGMEIGDVGDYKDVDMSLYEDEDVAIVEVSIDNRGKSVNNKNNYGRNYEVMDAEAAIKEKVKKWENEVEHWEKEMTRSATVELRLMAEEKLKHSQIMLNESLLQLTTAENSKTYNDSDEDLVSTSNEKGNDDRSGKELGNTTADEEGNTREKEGNYQMKKHT